MAKRKGKNKGKKAAGKADFTKHLNEGFEDPQFPYQKGTVGDFFTDVFCETGILPSTQGSTDKPEWGMLCFCAFVGAALFVSIAAIIV